MSSTESDGEDAELDLSNVGERPTPPLFTSLLPSIGGRLTISGFLALQTDVVTKYKAASDICNREWPQ